MAMTSALRLVTSEGAGTPRATIMIVDDDVVTAQILAQALEFAGYRVQIAPTASAACALQPRIRPDLIILDLMLPDMDGLALTTTLKKMTDAPIIICSARHGQIDRALGLRLGAVDFMAKPFDLDDFQARIDAVVASVRENARQKRTGTSSAAARAR
jgi:DNA-binding response OmpR family regulator